MTTSRASLPAPATGRTQAAAGCASAARSCRTRSASRANALSASGRGRSDMWTSPPGSWPSAVIGLSSVKYRYGYVAVVQAAPLLRRGRIAACGNQEGRRAQHLAVADRPERGNPHRWWQQRQLSVPIGDALYPFGKSALSTFPFGEAKLNVAGAIDGLRQYKSRHHRAAAALAEEGRLRGGGVTDKGDLTFRP